MIDLTIAEIADIVGGRLADITPGRPRRPASPDGGVRLEVRHPGGLFLALPGPEPTATTSPAVPWRRARWPCWQRARSGFRPSSCRPAAAEDAHSGALEHDVDGSGAAVLAALATLAAAVAADLVAGGLRIVGITGSSGKTSTKDLIAAVLRPLGEVVAPPAVQQRTGPPWTVLRGARDTDFLVLEMSARHPGNIAALARIAPPSIAVVLNVGTAHLGEFGSRQAIATTKAELVQAVPDPVSSCSTPTTPSSRRWPRRPGPGGHGRPR